MSDALTKAMFTFRKAIQLYFLKTLHNLTLNKSAPQLTVSFA